MEILPTTLNFRKNVVFNSCLKENWPGTFRNSGRYKKNGETEVSPI